MGIGVLRLILALTVVITHTHSIFGFTLGNPVIAVRIFFIISGFYMTLVLNEKYSYSKDFWINRALKIYPIYLVILAMTVLSCMGAYWLRGNWGEMTFLVNNWQYLDIWEQSKILISQIIIFGRNLVMFGGFAGRSGVDYLLVPQAWTLVLELWFYLLAPWLLTNGWRVVGASIIISLLSGMLWQQNGFSGDLWEYRFFPSEMVYFMMGYISYVLFIKIKFINIINKVPGWFFLVLSIYLISSFNFWPGNIYIKEWVLYILMVLLIPLMFNYSQKSNWDRSVGELSYPVYISHILINNILNPLLLIPFSINRNFQAIGVMVVSVLFSIGLNYFIQQPIERIRKKRV